MNKDVRDYAAELQRRADKAYYGLLLVAAIALGYTLVATWLWLAIDTLP